jgi:hypothetical protein
MDVENNTAGSAHQINHQAALRFQKITTKNNVSEGCGGPEKAVCLWLRKQLRQYIGGRIDDPPGIIRRCNDVIDGRNEVTLAW